ncbi:cytochrome P450 [Streptomyces sp. ALI-76-A]|uniref:cytochrome P450 n=1 Tax=Streptomyces sp. ALI-76-A TaxID=3025736 RepID=UPI00256EE10E|nr:cytochrome P450 [Streptomyces sp. ALI-76-A]MDL5200127.1 cytochrome P450 [Streptomyces sp. ALI-76-A]
MFRRPLEFLKSLPAHGDLVEIRLGPLRAWVVCHPELVHEMLRDTRTFDKGGTQYDRLRLLMGDGVVTCPHAEHRRQRRLVGPAFRPSRVAGHTDLMAEEAEAVCRAWHAGQRVDVSAAMMAMTTRVISRVLFSGSLDATRSAEVRRCLADVVRGLFVRTVVPLDGVFRLPTPANRRYRHAVARLHTIIDDLIAERRRGAARDDLLGTLLESARDDGGTMPPAGEREVHDQMITLLLTGVETTALCLASAFALLARNPEAERRLHAELDTVLAGRTLVAADLPHLVHTRNVVTETLRHSPPGWLFTRVTTRDTRLAGHRLPRGSTVLYSPYLLQHDPASFPDPDRFLPDRWLPGRSAPGPRGAMVPFAAGGRKCLGDTFAMTEAIVAVAVIAGRWRLRRPPGPVERPRPAVTLGPRSLVMTCEPRACGTTVSPARADAPAHRGDGALRVPEARTAGDHDVDDA